MEATIKEMRNASRLNTLRILVEYARPMCREIGFEGQRYSMDRAREVLQIMQTPHECKVDHRGYHCEICGNWI